MEEARERIINNHRSTSVQFAGGEIRICQQIRQEAEGEARLRQRLKELQMGTFHQLEKKPVEHQIIFFRFRDGFNALPSARFKIMYTL